ncbi:integrin alpha pat-2-like [Rhopilema esculentum]|uniref:integrin alpha pat-2-like n=1 Tax=Rhopilema esculentum TaxID=499914 RepID=UPI0031E06EEC
MHAYIGFVLLVTSVLATICAFNLDARTAKDFKSTEIGDYFGYSVALHQAGNDFWAVVGAPKGNDGKADQGAVYRCNVNSGSVCSKLQVDDSDSSSKNKSQQWMGGSVLSFGPDKEIVACAPRFKDIVSGLWLHGRCAVFNGKDFSRIRFWNPFQYSYSYQKFGYALQGFSIAKSISTRMHLITGMPGALNSAGAVGSEKLDSVTGKYPSRFGRSGDNRLTRDEYMGYSVAWGQFSDISHRIYGDIVGGAPKGTYGKGKVFIYEMGGSMNIHSVIENPDPNAHSGSYFGAAVCTVDLNKDGKPDLLIGAPFFTVADEDEGKVYIYLSDAKGTVNKVGDISGESRGGRFGTTISSVGDVNQDGYPDVAIGAPYGGTDGKGAVYIYHGSKNGLETTVVQKIYASDMPGNPAGFGQSISGELDIDKNTYPDIVVGSYASGQIHVLKSRPILTFSTKNELNTTKVSISKRDITPCREINREKYQCVKLDFCLSYTGSSVPATLDVRTEIETDKGKKGQRRAVMLEGNVEKRMISFQKQYTKGISQCEDRIIYVTQNPKSLSSGITVNINYKYMEPTSGCGGTVCPIGDYARDGALSRDLQQEITYLRGCKSETKCIADLVVLSKAEIPGGLKEIEFGVVEQFSLKINLENKGENAFLSKMNILYEDDFELIGVTFIKEQSPLREIKRENDKNKLTFSLPSPFAPNRKLDIEVRFSVSKLRPSKQKLSFVITATSDGSDEKNAKDNINEIILAATVRADLTVTGSATPYKITYDQKPITSGKLTNESQVGAIVNYKFLVQNLGPAPVQGISVRIGLLAKHQSKYVAMLFDAQIGKSSGCNTTGKINPEKMVLETFDLTNNRSKATTNEVKDLTDINCRTGYCIPVDCYIGFLGSGKEKEVTLRTRIYQNTFIEEKRGLSKITSKVSVIIDDNEKAFLRQPVNQKPDLAKVSVFVGPYVESKKGKTEEIAWWIILLAVLGGVLLIAVTVYVFYKVGFFKRKRVNDISGPTQDE